MPGGVHDWNWHVITPPGIDLTALPVDRVVVRLGVAGNWRWHRLVLDRVPIASSDPFATRELALADAESNNPGVNIVLDPGPS